MKFDNDKNKDMAQIPFHIISERTLLNANKKTNQDNDKCSEQDFF